MKDSELKAALETIRHKAIKAHLELDEITIFSLIGRKSKLKKIEADLNKLSLDVLELEDIFDEKIVIPSSFNEAALRAAQLSILFSIRSTTREAISSARAAITQIYNDINFYRSLIIALIALVVSIIGVIYKE